MKRASRPKISRLYLAHDGEAHDKLPEGEQWTYEVKWDGYRALLLKDHNHVQFRSRNDNNLTAT